MSRSRLALPLVVLVLGCGPAVGSGGEAELGSPPATVSAETSPADEDVGLAAPPGSDASTAPAPTSDASIGPEICGNGLDDDGNGAIDDGCACAPGATQKCYGGAPAKAGVGICAFGKQACVAKGEFGVWGACSGWVAPKSEACASKLDEDCDGKVDEDCDAGPPDTGVKDTGPVDTGTPPGCTVTVKLDIDGDCVSAKCPASAPYPVGCNIKFIGGTPCGCVASTPTSSTVFFKEGKVCDAGHLTGTLTCACKPGAGLNATNCPISDKTYKYYPTSSAGCPSGSCPI